MFANLIQFCEDHMAYIRYGGTALVAILALVTVYSWQMRVSAMQLEERFERAHWRALSVTSLDQRNDILKEYMEVLAAAPNKPFTPRILFSAAHECFYLARYEDALEYYRKLERNHPKHPLVPAARMGIGHCLEAAERYEGAMDAYRECRDMENGRAFHQECELGIARCLEAIGNLVEARETYEKLKNESPGTYWGRWAEQRLAYLELQDRSKNDSQEEVLENAQ